MAVESGPHRNITSNYRVPKTGLECDANGPPSRATLMSTALAGFRKGSGCIGLAVGSLSLMVTTVPLARVAEVCCCTQNVSPVVAKYW